MSCHEIVFAAVPRLRAAALLAHERCPNRSGAPVELCRHEPCHSLMMVVDELDSIDEEDFLEDRGF